MISVDCFIWIMSVMCNATIASVCMMVGNVRHCHCVRKNSSVETRQVIGVASCIAIPQNVPMMDRTASLIQKTSL